MTTFQEGDIFPPMNNTTAQNEKNLQKELNRAQKELAILYNVSNAMRTTLELNHILYIILTGVTAHTGLGFNRAILFLVNKKERCLEGKMVIGPDSAEQAEEIWSYIKETKHHLEDLITADAISQKTTQSKLFQAIQELKIPLNTNDGTLLCNAYHKGSPIHIDRHNIAQYENDPLLQVFQTTELIIMPLKAKDKVNGLIIADNFYTQKPITDEDLKIFTMLANQAALAIENSQLYEMVVHKSHTDSLTNLWNHGFFQHALATEIEKAKEEKTSLSLLMIDIDNFKKLNDQYGHQNGDIVLRELATVLKDSARDKDYVCRYGGEEFSIILPQTNKEQAFAIAERIRGEISRHNFQKFSLFKQLVITVSIGLATFPDDTEMKGELIARADKSMYVAKFGGKNRTCAAEKDPTSSPSP